jgi:hypothetical protein
VRRGFPRITAAREPDAAGRRYRDGQWQRTPARSEPPGARAAAGDAGKVPATRVQILRKPAPAGAGQPKGVCYMMPVCGFEAPFSHGVPMHHVAGRPLAEWPDECLWWQLKSERYDAERMGTNYANRQFLANLEGEWGRRGQPARTGV